ncbi:MAG: hypothetical protein RLY58_1453 [Pseudomonadota bacterium]|jgi:glycosyltransferase involved in cell wall biosynthesis
MARVTLIMAGDEEGGLEKHVVELAAALAERGHGVSLIAHEKYRARLDRRIVFYAVNLARGRRNLLVLAQLWYSVRQSSPEVIHAHGNKAAAMVGSLLGCWRGLGALSVATLHARKKKTTMYARFDRVIAVSERAAAAVQHPHVRVILNGILPPVMAVAACPPQQQTLPIVLAVGRLVQVKGFDVLIRAWRNVPARLWIAGDGPERAALQALIEAEGQAGRIALLGHRDDVNQLMQQATLHVISSHDEGGPYTFSEALLAQTPVVSTRVGMPATSLPAAYVCEPNQPDALQQVLIDALADTTQTQHDFAPIFQWATQHLTLSAMVQGVEAVYAERPDSSQKAST